MLNGCKSRVNPNSGNYIAKGKVKAQKLQKQHALKVSYQNKAPSLFLNPYCQRILVKVYAVMLDEQRERASGSQLVRCTGLETA